MQVNKKRLYLLPSMLIMLTGCEYLQETKDTIKSKVKGIGINIEKTIIEQKTIYIACDKEEIKAYTDKGWKVTKKSEREIPCSWKEKRSKPGCNLELDKGCRITVPDKMGIEVEYQIERRSRVDKTSKHNKKD